MRTGAEIKRVVHLFRHSMTKGNLEHRYIGKTVDEPLCEEGIELAKARATELGPIPGGYVFVSPMVRCRQTAEILFPEKEQICVEDIMEIDFGDFSNKTYLELDGNEDYQKWIDSNGTLPFPNGESKEYFVERNIRGIEQIFEMAEDKGMKEFAIVAHGGTVMAFCEHYIHGDYHSFHVENAAEVVFEFYEDGTVEKC